jgi:hypothetical protein
MDRGGSECRRYWEKALCASLSLRLGAVQLAALDGLRQRRRNRWQRRRDVTEQQQQEDEEEKEVSMPCGATRESARS